MFSKTGILNMGGMLVSSAFPKPRETGKYSPGDLTELSFRRQELIAAYFHDSLLLTAKDLEQVGTFIRDCPRCRFVCLKNNRIGFRQDKEAVASALLALIRGFPEILFDLTGNPCVTVDYTSCFFSTITSSQARMFQFLSFADFEAGSWEALFGSHDHKDEIIQAVQCCHRWLFANEPHPLNHSPL